ncbi:MAG: histidine phosphatase family protein [Desulfobacterales bacterium]
MQTRLIVLRHGETVWNAEERFQGHGDSPLTETGRRQAAALGRRVREIGVDVLIASDLGRTRQTAAYISEATGHRIRTDKRLRERNYGVLEGLTLPEIQEGFPTALARLRGDDPEYVIPGGESHRQHYERNVDFIRSAVADHPGVRIALVAHGGVLDSLFRFVARLPLNHPRCFTTANASLSVFVYGQFYGSRRWVIETWCDIGHLDGIGFFGGLG